MTKHVMALTYAPKIGPVQSGECRQTIRKGRKYDVGDEILIHPHGDMCKEWEWWMCVEVRAIIDLVIDASDSFTYGVVDLVTDTSDSFTSGIVPCMAAWSSEYADMIAYNDFIDPPTGEALRDVLFGFCGVPDGPTEYQIIMW